MGRDKKNREEGGGGGEKKIVILSTANSTQIPNHKTSKTDKILDRGS